MIELMSNILIISVDGNGLNSPIEEKDFSLANEPKSNTMQTTKDTHKTKRFKRIKNKRLEKNVSGKPNKKKTGVLILIPDKVEVRPKTITMY